MYRYILALGKVAVVRLFVAVSRHFIRCPGINARLENIDFVSCSDSISPLDLSGPIAQELATLETEGTLVFNAYFQEVVLVIVPLIVIVCDNPRASDLVNHLGSKVLLYLHGKLLSLHSSNCYH